VKRYLVLLVLVLAVILSACGPAATPTLAPPANKLEAIQRAGKIMVGTSADYPPFEFVDANGNKTGFDVDLMTEIAKRMGVTLEWVDMPFDSLIAGVQEGKMDASIAAFNYDEERALVVDFTDAYYTTEDCFMVKEDFAGTIAKPEDIATLTVGVQTGTVQDGWLTDSGIVPEEQIVRYDRADQAALDLKAGRIDVLMADLVPAQALATQIGGLKVVWNGVLSTGPLNIVLPKGEDALKAEFNRIIKQLLDENFIYQLAVKYFSQQ
jgi:polar amino acid transport system substrate-binding protein